jgi:hypothetical protein
VEKFRALGAEVVARVDAATERAIAERAAAAAEHDAREHALRLLEGRLVEWQRALEEKDQRVTARERTVENRSADLSARLAGIGAK